MSYRNPPPVYADEDKFDGTNWVTWSKHINIAVQLKGASGYLNGTISNPTAQNTIPKTTSFTLPTTTPVTTITETN